MMKRELAWVVCGAALLTAAPKDAYAETIPQSYIVAVAPGANPRGVAQGVSRKLGGNVSHVYQSTFRGFAIRLPKGKGAAHILAEEQVLFVEPDLKMSIGGTRAAGRPPGKGKPGDGGGGDPPAPAEDVEPTGVRRIGAGAAASVDLSGVTVAVLDTGIDLNHPDLNVNKSLSITFAGGKNADDKNGHGTHVAGTIGAKSGNGGVVGVAPGVSLVAVKVLGNNGSGSLSNIIAGIDYVTNNADVIDVVNMSLGGTGISAAFNAAIANSVAQGVVYVVAAGNSSRDVYGADGKLGTSDDTIPAAYVETLTVSAMADSDGIGGGLGGDSDDVFANWFSNFSRTSDGSNPVNSLGRAIDIAAPGVDILSTYKDGAYATLSGTSMASPHLAGTAAICIALSGSPTDAAGVYALRQQIVVAAEPQPLWRNDGQTSDSDVNLEGVVDVPALLTILAP